MQHFSLAFIYFESVIRISLSSSTWFLPMEQSSEKANASQLGSEVKYRNLTFSRCYINNFNFFHNNNIQLYSYTRHQNRNKKNKIGIISKAITI